MQDSLIGMDVSDIINKIYRLPQTSLDTLIGSVSEVEYPSQFPFAPGK